MKFNRAFIERTGLALLAIVLVFFSASLGRGLWMDEILQFAMGSFSSTKEAWNALLPSIGGFNHNQTGFYYLLDHWILRITGASAFWTRSPSILCGLLFFFYARIFFQLWGVSLLWQVFGFLALYSNPWLSYYIGEARPYMQLVTFSLGMLVYYSASDEKRKTRLFRCIAFSSVIFGGLFHPYFILYWFFSALLGFFYRYLKKEILTLRFKTLLQHFDPKILATGLVSFFSTGLLTWMTHRNHFSGLDIYQWLPKDQTLFRRIIETHFQEMSWLFFPFVFVFVASVFVLYNSPLLRKIRAEFFGAQALALGALALSGLLCFASYLTGYWIIERQWVASIAFVILASAVFCSHIFKLVNRPSQIAWVLVIFAAVGVSTAEVTVVRFRGIYHHFTFSDPDVFTNLDQINIAGGDAAKTERFVEVNCLQRKPVHKKLKLIYGIKE